MNYDFYSGLRAENLTADDQLRYRHEIKRHLAVMGTKLDQVGELKTVHKSIFDNSEEAANSYSAICEPLQAELRDLEEQSIAAKLAKRTPPPGLANRRIEILRAKAEENSKLEMIVAANKKSAAKVQAEIDRTLGETTYRPILENTLVNLASVALRDQHACLINRSEWAAHRMKSEGGFIELNHERIAAERAHRNPNKQNIQIYERRMRQHKVLADDAAAEVNRLNAELAKMRQAMLDE